jgi:hypothetical protein
VQETASAITDEGGQALAITADVSREEEARRIMEEAVRAFGRLDCLINNAGDGGPTKPVQDHTTDEWFYTINSCLTSSFLCRAPGAVEGERIDRVIAGQAEMRDISVDEQRKAFIELCKAYGPPESLVIEDVPALSAEAGQVVVSVKAASLNFPDVLIISSSRTSTRSDRRCRFLPAVKWPAS